MKQGHGGRPPPAIVTTSIRERYTAASAARQLKFHGMIETFRPVIARGVFHLARKEINRTDFVAQFGGSDAHANSMIGRGFPTFPGTTIEELLEP